MPTYDQSDLETLASQLIILEVPIPNHDPISNLQSTMISIKSGPNFVHAATNIVMTHTLVLSAKMRKNE